MHELSVAESLLKIIKEEMAKHNVNKLIRVKIKYGQISAIVPEALQTAFQVLTADTPLEGAEIITEEVPLKARCRVCKREFTPDPDEFVVIYCPYCKAEFGHEIISGKELIIEEIEAE
ncbi:hydrogenase nickel incorporation protein HypA/HybF [Desulfonauticus submarinus]|uniref:Hydrogenase maturation factor HypA n=1 Tax=Desulfonauticus submarinus TaxID=206665 RepID=A0A1H0ACB8_9BACT|nr:hydrogenase maturation nickel metallochaperone HypA [Desulfonauticus submarinus]SDN31292.1 hydrogenase nickel incorporation protein HypA/HybF [Desulfonauticus submarinus]